MLQSLRFQALLAFAVISGGAAQAQTLAKAELIVPAPLGIPLTSVPAPPRMEVYPDSVYVNPEVHPKFVGGDKAFAAYLTKSIKYPQLAMQRKVSGRVMVNFVLNAEGRVQDAHVISGPGSGLNDEALRLVWLMPPWEPARVNGQPVRVACTVPISFSLGR